MLSNLSVRSNIIESRRTPECCKISGIPGVAPLARISARDLNELSELNPMGDRYLDTRIMNSRPHGLPTPEQCQQWESYLFYGDKTISLSVENRLGNYWLIAAGDLCSLWPKIKAQLNHEVAMECLCVLIAFDEHPQVKELTEKPKNIEQRELNNIKEEILKFFHDIHLDTETAYQRAHQILGLIE